MYQESGRHSETLDAITTYLDMGTYSEWDEDKKLEFLTRELKGKRPLIPPTIEVIALPRTFQVLNNRILVACGSHSRHQKHQQLFGSLNKQTKYVHHIVSMCKHRGSVFYD